MVQAETVQERDQVLVDVMWMERTCSNTRASSFLFWSLSMTARLMCHAATLPSASIARLYMIR